MLTCNIDPRDHPFIVGATVEGVESKIEATKAGTMQGWEDRSKAMTFPDLIRSKLSDPAKIAEWDSKCYEMSLCEMKAMAERLGVSEPYFCWEKARVCEGYYSIQGGTRMCVERAKAFSAYADIIWMETKKPTYKVAKEFRDAILKFAPHQMLAYNQSPSFNWDAADMTDEEMRTYIERLGKLGFCWQFITLAGFHCDALAISQFAREYKKDGMKAYVQMVQRKEREFKVATLKHQKWSGAEYIDKISKTINAGMSSTDIMGE